MFHGLRINMHMLQKQECQIIRHSFYSHDIKIRLMTHDIYDLKNCNHILIISYSRATDGSLNVLVSSFMSCKVLFSSVVLELQSSSNLHPALCTTSVRAVKIQQLLSLLYFCTFILYIISYF